MKPTFSQYGERSEHQDLLAKGLGQFQSAVRSVPRNADGPNGKYSDLDAVCSTISAALPDTGLSYCQFPHDYGEGKIVLETTILHESGQFRTGYKAIFTSGVDDADQGGGVGYWSRICLMRAFGLRSESLGTHDPESDDGKPGRGKFEYASLKGESKRHFDRVIMKLSSPDVTQEDRDKILSFINENLGKGVWTQEMKETIEREFYKEADSNA